MKKTSFIALGLTIFLAFMPVRPASAVDDEEVGKAITRIKAYLYNAQNADGGWDAPKAGMADHAKTQHSGTSALVLFALLSSGESIHHPKIVKGLKWLQDNPGEGTYAVGIRAHVWAQLPDSYRDQLEIEGNWLKTAQTEAVFDYGPYRGTRVDHSVTQYGTLGLWEVSKRLGNVSPGFWKTSATHFINTQVGDGGWSYGATGESRASMTTAGLTCLYVAQQQAFRDQEKAEPKIAAAIEKGMKWLDERFDGGKNVTGSGGTVGHDMYHLYGIERVALASGVKYLNDQDWYESGAEYILKRLGNGGSVGALHDTAFALGFLARGRYPVWITKLEVPGAETNNRPNDVYFWNDYLVKNTERFMNWQTVSIDRDASHWRNAPVAYLCSQSSIDLTEKQRDNLKKFLDLGGVLLCVSEKNSKSFSNSMRKIGSEMYPDLKWEKPTPDHLIYNQHYRLGKDGAMPIQVLSNGARDLIYIVENDWSMTFQRDDPPGKGRIWQVSSNFFALATERGAMPNRLNAKIETRNYAKKEVGELTIAKVKYDGSWDPEPLAHAHLATNIYNNSGVDVKSEVVELAELGSSSYGLAHLSGTDKVEFTAEELASIKTFVDNGGTLLIETVGGHGEFSRVMEENLVRFLDTSAVLMDPSHKFITGAGIEGGRSASAVLYTRTMLDRLSVGTSPKLLAFYINERPAIVVSHDDLSCGVLGVKQWGILGYSQTSAQKLMNNIVLGSGTLAAAVQDSAPKVEKAGDDEEMKEGEEEMDEDGKKKEYKFDN